MAFHGSCRRHLFKIAGPLREAMAGRAASRCPDASVGRTRCRFVRARTGAGFFLPGARWPNPGTWPMLPEPQRHLEYRRVATVPVRRALPVRNAWPTRPTVPQPVRQRLESRLHLSPRPRAQARCARQAFLPAYRCRGNAERPPRSPGAPRPKRICVTPPERCASLRPVQARPRSGMPVRGILRWAARRAQNAPDRSAWRLGAVRSRACPPSVRTDDRRSCGQGARQDFRFPRPGLALAPARLHRRRGGCIKIQGGAREVVAYA